MAAELNLRLMRAADLEFADSVRNAAGWNQTREDFASLLAHEPEGCFVAEWSGKPVGTATTTRHGDGLAWIGMLLVDPEHRGRGVGTALLVRCLQHLENVRCRCIKLDATPAGKGIYERFGFQAEWSLTRWEAEWTGTEEHSPGVDIRDLREFEPNRLAILDARAFGSSRWKLLSDMIDRCICAAGCGNASTGPDGFGVLRSGSRARYLGPVVAIRPACGRQLIQTLLKRMGPERVFWDIPDANAAAVSLAKECGFRPQRPLTRMFRGAAEFGGRPEWQFAIADPAIG